MSNVIWNHYLHLDPRLITDISSPEQRELAVKYIGRTVNTPQERLKKQINGSCGPKQFNWLRSLNRQGLEPILIDLGPGDEDEERRLIAYYRSMGNNLNNLTDGGDGIQGFKYSEETKARMVVSLRATWARPEVKQKRSESMRTMWARSEVKKKHSESMRIVMAHPEYRQNHSDAMARPEVKQKRAATMARPDVKKKVSDSIRVAMARPDVKQKHSEAMRTIWARPEMKKKASEIKRVAYASPEAREKMRLVNIERYNPGMTLEQYKIRCREAYALRQAGMTIQQVADKLSISRRQAQIAIKQDNVGTIPC